MFRGLGDTKSPLWATLICNGVNVVLDAVFIMYFGWGVRGAAWATIIGQVTSLSSTHTTTQYSAIVKTHTALHGTMQSCGELACFGIFEL